MKKLYAKTSFTHKNRSNKCVIKASDDNDICHEPILAYQSTLSETQSVPPPPPSATAITSYNRMLRDTKPPKYTPRYPFVPSVNSDHTNLRKFHHHPCMPMEDIPYYSIAELDDLHLLDHRHPEFHQMLRMQQTKVYHNHNELVLQLPMASEFDSHDLNVTPLASPIYEAPQIVGFVGNSGQKSQRNYMLTPTSLTTNLSSASSTLSSSSSISTSSATTSPTMLRLSCSANVKSAKSLNSITPPPQTAITSTSTASHDYNIYESYKRNQPQFFNNSILATTSFAHGLNIGLTDNMQHSTDPLKYYCAMTFQFTAHPSFRVIEQSIIGARASVMVYDDNQKKWVPSGTSSGLSKVQIYHHQQNNTFRVVGRKLQDHEVVINCSILKGLKYNQATATFHQWRDSKYVYGLNFSSQHDAESFARAMMHALDVLSGRVINNAVQPTNGNSYEEDMGYRTMTSEDAAMLRQQQQITGQVTPSAQTPTSQTNQNNIPQSPPTPQGHHRTSR
uniref:WH1 domain-containing protein n=1 Tax=Glossina pallidipes TaxID=7398 RepID=A0A1A9ZCX3_GLOPL